MDADHYRLRDFFTRTAQPCEWYEALGVLGLVGEQLGELLVGEACVEDDGAAQWRERHRRDRSPTARRHWAQEAL